MDYYDILGVSKDASDQEIKKSYRRLSLKHHPDRGGNAEEFKKINEAYSTLSDSGKKRQYDMRNQGFGGMNGMDIGMDPLFKMFFGANMTGMHGMPNVQIFRNGQPVNINRVMKPRPINKRVTINLETSYTGATIPVSIKRTIQTGNEKKTEEENIYIPIKAGIDNGELIILKDKGDIFNDIKGDVKIFVTVQNKTDFARDGLDLLLSKTINLKEALTGFTFDIKHLNGKTYAINNESGNIISPSYIKKVNGLGMNREGRSGNLIISFKVSFPDTLTEKQIKELKKIL